MVTLYLLAIASDAQQGRTVPTLDKVAVDITVVLGTTSMPIHQVLRLGRGAIIDCQDPCQQPADSQGDGCGER